MRPKIVVSEQSGKVLFGAWMDPAGEVYVGGKVGKLKVAKMFLGERAEYREVGEGRTHFRLLMGMKWELLLEKIRNEGLRICKVRGFRRIIH